jgi:hypothetical protein
MRRSTVYLLILALALSPVIVAEVGAQADKHDATELDLLEGRIVRIDKEKSTVEIRQSGPSSVMWTVGWDDKTYFSYRNEASSLEDLKNGRKVICLGKFDEGSKMKAARIDVREGK